MKKKICGQTSASNKASSKRIPIPVPPSIVNHGATITTESHGNGHGTMRPETLLLLLLLPVQSSKLQEHHREGRRQSKRSITAQ
jgi:hypothetical protein